MASNLSKEGIFLFLSFLLKVGNIFNPLGLKAIRKSHFISFFSLGLKAIRKSYFIFSLYYYLFG